MIGENWRFTSVTNLALISSLFMFSVEAAAQDFGGGGFSVGPMPGGEFTVDKGPGLEMPDQLDRQNQFRSKPQTDISDTELSFRNTPEFHKGQIPSLVQSGFNWQESTPSSDLEQTVDSFLANGLPELSQHNFDATVSDLMQRGVLQPRDWKILADDWALRGLPESALIEQVILAELYSKTPGGAPNPYRPWNEGHNPACICGGDPAGPIPIPSMGGSGLISVGSPGAFSSIDVNVAQCNKAPKLAMAGTDESSKVVSFATCAAQNSFATTVALLDNSGETVCSGVLVGESNILTAAHCFCDQRWPTDVFFGDRAWTSAPAHLRAAIRAEYRFADGNPEFFNADFCEQYRVHKADRNMGRDTVFPEGDLAIATLRSKLDTALALSILPTEPLWQTVHGADIETVFIAGFGVRDGADNTGRKHFADVELVPDACISGGGFSDQCRQGSEFVARGLEVEDNADSCFGDSGGPLFVELAEDSQRSYPVRRLAGIVSRGIAENEKGGCGGGGIYTDLRNKDIQEWILETIWKTEEE